MSGHLDPSITIRQFRPDDQEAVISLILNGLGEHFGHIDHSLNPDLDDISGSYLSQGHHFVVAVKDENIIGAGGLLLVNEDEGRIVRLSVSGSYRGQGLGSSIVTTLLGLAGELGLSRVHVETNLDWYQAIALYERCGFERISADSESAYMVVELESNQNEG
jgi:N-acetylglutamate synthase-like GNAT family acetyltransferase